MGEDAWVSVVPRSTLVEGKGLHVVVGAHEIALFLVGGALYALGAVCPHSGGPIHQGFIADGWVKCPLHLWEFELRSGRHRHLQRICLPRYPVREHQGQVQVQVPP